MGFKFFYGCMNISFLVKFFIFLLDIKGVVFVVLKDYVVLLVVFCERGVMIF